MNDYETKLAIANQQAAILSWVMLYSVALIAFIAAVIWLFKMAQQRRKQRLQEPSEGHYFSDPDVFNRDWPELELERATEAQINELLNRAKQRAA